MKIPFLNKFKRKKSVIPKIGEGGGIGVKDIIAPPSIKVNPDCVEVGERFAKTFFVFSYPRYLSTGWFSSVVNMDYPMDISFFLHPIETNLILKQLRRRVTESEAELAEREEKGLIRDPSLETAYRDLEQLRDRLTTAQERMFQLGIYITVYTNDKNKLDAIESDLRSSLEARLVYIKPSLYQQDKGFNSTAPYGTDLLDVHTPMNTSPLSSIFPFISFDLSSNKGILYGINRHNSSLILFDRFSLENANTTVFGVAGSGKSYTIKLELLRSLMAGTDCIVLDPENEYRQLSDAVQGSFFSISLSSENHINPFDLPEPQDDEDPSDVLRSNIINLVGLLRIMLGGLTPEEDGIIDIALTETYASKDINPHSDPKEWKENIPLMEDLEAVLETMEGTESLLARLRKYTAGTYSKFFNQQSNVNMENNMVVFGIRDMEEELRPIAMFIVMRYIWNAIRTKLKKRILVIDEAWWLMKTDDGASFLYGLAKRARKYWLGVTTVTQDVVDFMKSDYGKPIITNSALHILMKQSPAMIGVVKKTFDLTEGEKNLLLECPIGEGLFFAGLKHVLMKVVASYVEDQFITTSPEEVSKIREAKKKDKSTLDGGRKK
jgi:conjugal transfer ATP-binding protein TraC